MKSTFLLSLCSAAALWAAACSGGGSTTVTTPPPNNDFSNASLAGQYVFSMSGSFADTAVDADEPYTRTGVFIADGGGNITGGMEDVNLAGSTNEYTFTTGTYTVNGNGTGTMSLTDSSGAITFAITLSSSTSGYVADFPTDGGGSASGSFTKQSAGPFTLSNLNGTYAFDFSGVDPSGNPESVVGEMAASNNGTTGALTGIADDNDAAVINGGAGGGQPVSGSFAADSLNPTSLTSFGRGVFTAGGIQGVFYVVGPNQAQFMETTSGGTLAGSAMLQSSIPTSTAGISGNFVYVMGGSGEGAPFTRGGTMTTSSGALSAIYVDTNNSGSPSSFGPTNGTSTGTYTIDPGGSGRGTVSFNVSGQANAFTYVFYLISPTQGFIQDQSLNIVEDGSLLAQGSSTISNSSLAGSYAINWSGETGTNNGEGEEDLVGQLALSSGSITGTVDLNEFASDAQYTSVSTSGTLQLSSTPTSHNSLTLNLATNPANNGISFFAYVANNNTILLMATQKNVRIAVGVMAPQNP
jgi:hypothetical protein